MLNKALKRKEGPAQFTMPPDKRVVSVADGTVGVAEDPDSKWPLENSLIVIKS